MAEPVLQSYEVVSGDGETAAIQIIQDVLDRNVAKWAGEKMNASKLRVLDYLRQKLMAQQELNP